jgi:diguanylate cyclase (GGDEF)-like protein
MANLRTEAVQAKDRALERLEGVLASGHRWLRFPRALESEFLADYAGRFLTYRRRIVLAAALVVVFAGLLDLLFLQLVQREAFALRYIAGAPLMGLFLLFSRTRGFAAAPQAALWVLVLLMVALLLGLMYIGGDQVVMVYSPGVLLLAVFAGLLLHLTFWSAVGLLAVIGAAFVVLIAELRPQPHEIVIANVLFYLAATLVALVSCYHMEYAARRQFLQDRLLELKQGELETANRQLQELVDQDGLTGIANRRHFDRQLAAEWNRARRGGYPLSLLLIDLDYFKLFNDTYGHQAGDDCLIVVGSVLRGHAQRSGDLAARYGGEEFALILPATTAEDAEEIGWRIVNDIAAYRIPHAASQVSDVVTTSVGAATIVPTPFDHSRELVEAADAALYRAKAGGRNRVVCAPARRDGGSAAR